MADEQKKSKGNTPSPDSSAEVHGVFFTQEVRNVGTGHHPQTVQKIFWFKEWLRAATQPTQPAPDQSAPVQPVPKPASAG